MVPLAESVRRHIQTGQVKEVEKLSGGEGSKLKMLHSVMGDRIPDPIWIGARNKIFSESKSGIFAHQNSSGLTIEFNANHVFLPLPRGVSSTPPCTTLIGSTIHMLPSHVHVLGVETVLWAGGGENQLAHASLGNFMIWSFSCSPPCLNAYKALNSWSLKSILGLEPILEQ